MDRIEELGKRGEALTGVATGYHELDKILLGLQPSSLVIVGARPGMGKTSFALGILAHVGMVAQRPALLFSLEMGHLELTQRLLASEAEVNGQSLQTGRIRSQDWAKLGAAVTKLSNAPIFIDDNPDVTVMDIRARARRLKKTQGDLGLVVVDYLQLMTGRARAENRQNEVAEISRGLKILARELEVPVVALSQLSRNLESRHGQDAPALGPARVGITGAGRRCGALHLPRGGVQRRGADRPGRRRTGRRGQAPQRPDREGQPVVLEAVRPLREPSGHVGGAGRSGQSRAISNETTRSTSIPPEVDLVASSAGRGQPVRPPVPVTRFHRASRLSRPPLSPRSITAQKRISVTFMYATAWHNGGPPREPAGYGLKLAKVDRDRYFVSDWDDIVLELEGAEATTIPLSAAFWRSGAELRSAAVGEWLLANDVAPWARGSPPGIVVTEVEGNRFAARILKRKALGR